MAGENGKPIVCDFGTSTVVAGFAGEDTPNAVFSCVVGKPKKSSKFQKDYYVGDEADSNIEGLTLNMPVDGGIVIDWDDMERIYHHTFYNELRIAPEEHPVLLTQPTLKHDANVQEKKVHRENREKMSQVMFEDFNVPAMYVSLQPVLALISSGKESGLVLDLGAKSSQCVPIYEGQVVTRGIQEFGMAGHDLTDHFTQILSRKGYSFTTQAEREIVKDIKEKLGYIAIDYDKELKRYKTKNYELPDRQVITVGAELFKCPEALFQPSMARNRIHVHGHGIHQVVYNSINMCNQDIRKELFENILLRGRSTMFPGFADRLKKEVSMLVEDNTSINIEATKWRRYHVWIGGAVLASLSNFQQMWVTKSEYDETGASIVHDRCF